MPAPAPHTDALIRRLEGEVEERSALIQGIAQDAQAAGRDLNDAELEQIARARTRIGELNGQLDPLRDASRVAIESRQRTEQLHQELAHLRGRTPTGGAIVEYRSVGAYAADLYAARMGERDAADRIESFNRAAAHQTTADNPGLLPQRIIEPVLNELDASRPLVAALGPQELGDGSYAYARVTQRTLVGEQSAEKAELPSRKMTVSLTPIAGSTYGGYLNISRQDIRRTGGRITDMVISDLAGQYGLETEEAAGAALIAAATDGTVEIPATPTVIGISSAIWGAVGQAAAGLRTANVPATGPILAVSPDMLGLVGPLFPAVNPQNAISTGFTADGLLVQGAQGNISGLTVVMSTGLPTGTMLLTFKSAVRVFEDRYGALTVDEPSVWGMQVGYAGDFETVVYSAAGVIAIDQAA